MEKIYTREELQKKTKPYLEIILGKLNLKTTGRKADLIDRILSTQITSKPTRLTDLDKSYLNLLPGDLKRLVDEYRAENEPNNQILLNILRQLELSSWGYGTYTENHSLFKLINQFFKASDLPITLNFIPGLTLYGRVKDMNDPRTPWMFKIGRLPLISDDILVDFIIFLLSHKYNIRSDTINGILYEYESELRVIEVSISPKLGKKRIMTRYEISRTRILKYLNP